MSEDQDRDQDPEVLQDNFYFRPTRRAVLAGATALAVSPTAEACSRPTRHFSLDFLDKARRQVVVLTDVGAENDVGAEDVAKKPAVLRNDRDPKTIAKERAEESIVTHPTDPKFLLSWDRREFGPNASFRIERKSAKHWPDGEPRPNDPKNEVKTAIWLPITWTLHVERASFPGAEDKEFSADFVFSRKTVCDEWVVSAGLHIWWERRSTRPISSSQVLLEHFIRTTGECRIKFEIRRSDANGLLGSLFGDRIWATVPLLFSVDRKLDWAIDADLRTPLPSAVKPNTAGTVKRKGRLFVLNIPLEFGGLSLKRIRSDLVDAKEQQAAAAPGEKQEVLAVKAKRTTERLFEAEVIHGQPAKPSKPPIVRPDGLYGEINNIGGFTVPNASNRDREDVVQTWSFDFARLVAGETTAINLSIDQAAIAFGNLKDDQKGIAQAAAAIRHWGYPQHTVAGCIVRPRNDARRLGRLKIRHGSEGAKIEEGPFEFSGFEIVRQYRDKAGAVITRLSVQPVARDTDVGLQFGHLCISALPATSGKPGAPPAIPQIVVEATEKPYAPQNKKRILQRFEGRVALSGAAIHLPERTGASTAETQAAIRPHITRLTFVDADALLYLPLLGDAPVTSADAVVPIGPRSSEVSSVTIDLDRARLSILRPDDLLALKFRFAGLELIAPWPPAPNRTAELRPRGGRSTGRPFVKAANSAATPRDERPLIVVEFPPQHVVERAYFKQIPTTPELPELSASDSPETKLIDEAKRELRGPKQWYWKASPPSETPTMLRWRNWVAELLEKCGARPGDVGETTRERRIVLRQKIQLTAKWPSQQLFAWDNAAENKRMKADRFQKLFDEGLDALSAERSGKIPEEQRLYVGSEFLDPDARRIANEAMRKLKEEQDQHQPAPPSKDRLPSVRDIPESEWKAIFRPFIPDGQIPSVDKQADWPTLDTFKDTSFKTAVVQEVELARERRDREYAAFRAIYRKCARERGAPAPPEYFGAHWFDEVLGKNGSLDSFKDTLLRELRSSNDEQVDQVVPARLSGPSRIAFRVNCDDYESDRPGGRIPFTLEGLTNWGGMDMAVVRRAERLMEPLQGTTRLPPRWGRRAANDDGLILHFQGFSSSERWGLADEPYRRAPTLAAVTARQRLAEVYASSSKEPDAFETAIELPFRLFLSPAQDATWVTSAPRVRRDAGLPDDLDMFRELWTARLAGQGDSAGVRATWSPDYRPEALLSTDDPGAPPIGAYAPWALPRSFGLRKSPPDSIQRFRTGLEAFDRHELVILSSVHGLPVLGRRAPNGDIAPDADQIEPPKGFRLQGVLREKQNNQDFDMTAIYRPKPLSVNELSLSALGGNLDIDTGFQPPASARDGSGRNLFDALSIERWRQRTVLGRDIVVEVVYKGFLFPLGHRASLVKLTERRFVSIDGSPSAVLVQRLFLRVAKPEKRFPAEGQANRASRWPCERINILTRQTPDLVDARNDDTPKDAEFIYLDPKDPQGRAPPQKDRVVVTKRGRIMLKNDAGKLLTGTCLWPRTSAREGAEVWFEMQIGDEAVPVRMPLIFVDNIGANDENTVATLVKYYNRQVGYDSAKSPTRQLRRNGQPVVMAPEYKVGDTTFETKWWRVAAEGREKNLPYSGKDTIQLDNELYTRDSFMEGQDQPPFYPIIGSAYCRLKSVERFTGSGPLWAEVTFDGEYVANGFVDVRHDGTSSPREQQSEIYLRILPDAANPDKDTVDLDFQDRGDLSGGIARPTMAIVALSRSLGPINGGKDGVPPQPPRGSPAINAPIKDTLDKPNPTTPSKLPVLERLKRFEDSINIVPNGKFLGIMELKDLVQLVLGVELHPKLTDVIEYGSASLADAAGKAVVAAGAAAADVRSALTKAIITPALDAVVEVDKAWVALAQKQLGVGTEKPPTLDQIYPQIGTDIRNLEELLRKAQGSDLSDAEYFASLSAIHEAARRLIRSIEAIARDPLAAAASAQVDLFKRLFEPIKEIRESIGGFEALTQLSARLPSIVTTAVEESIKAELGAQVPDGISEKVAVLEAIAKAVGDCLPPKNDWQANSMIGLPRKLASKLRERFSQLPAGTSSEAREALEKIQKNLERIADQIDTARLAAKQVREELAKYAAEDPALKELTDNATERLARGEKTAKDLALDALLSKPVVTALRVAADTSAALKTIPSPPFDQDKLNRLFSAIVPLLSLVLDVNKAEALADRLVKDSCGKIKDALHALLAAVLPDQSILEIDASCEKPLGEGSLPASCTIGSGPVADLFRVLRDARDELGKVPGGDKEKDEFDAAAARLLAAIGRVGRDQKQLAAAVSSLPVGACTVPPKDLHSGLRNISADYQDMVVAARSFFDTTVTILVEKLGRRVVGLQIGEGEKAALKSAFEKTATSIDGLLTTFPKLIPVGNASVDAKFKSAIEGLAASIGTALPGTAQALRDLVTRQADQAALVKRLQALDTAKKELAKQVGALIAGETGVDQVTSALKTAGRELLLAGETVRFYVEDIVATDLYSLLADAAGRIEKLFDPLNDALGTFGANAFGQLDKVYGIVIDDRKKLVAIVTKQRAYPVIKTILDRLAVSLGAGNDAQSLFNVYAADDPKQSGPELLASEQELVKAVAAGFRSTNATVRIATLAKLDQLLQAWKQPAIVKLFHRFSKIDSSFLRAVLVDALDLRAIKHELERIVRELVPTRASLSYDFSTPVRKFSLPGVGEIFLPVKGNRLDIKMRASVDLINPSKPDARIDGHLGPFGIQLFGDFDVVVLNFRGLDFRSGGGRSPGFDVRFGDFVIGSKAKFLKQLEPYVSPKAGLPPVRMMKDKPGIEATYGVNLGSFGVGTLSFSNVTLNAGARLPFGAKEEAEFLISIGRSDAPFLISSTIFGGGGYLALLANGKGFMGLETSFDYGGVFTFGFGPLSGTGQITLGLYFRAARGEPARLGMNFMARGAANIACFSFSTSLFVRLTYADGKMTGQATYTFSFSLGVYDVDFRIDVVVDQGSSAGQAKAAFLDLQQKIVSTTLGHCARCAQSKALMATSDKYCRHGHCSFGEQCCLETLFGLAISSRTACKEIRTVAYGLGDLEMFAAVARHRSFRGAAARLGLSAAALSEAVRRLEKRLETRLLNRTTRSVAPTDAGEELLARLEPALGDIATALDAVRGVPGPPRGRIRLNVPTFVADVMLAPIVKAFADRCPAVVLEVVAEDRVVDIFAEGFDAGVRYDERLAKDSIAVAFGPRIQRYAVAAAPSYWSSRPKPMHPSELLDHACIRHRFDDRASSPWIFERNGEAISVDPPGILVANTLELRLRASLAGVGIIASFHEHLAPHLESGALEPVLEPWWPSFSGPFLYFPSRRQMRAPLRAFLDFLREPGG